MVADLKSIKAGLYNFSGCVYLRRNRFFFQGVTTVDYSRLFRTANSYAGEF